MAISSRGRDEIAGQHQFWEIAGNLEVLKEKSTMVRRTTRTREELLTAVHIQHLDMKSGYLNKELDKEFFIG